MKQAALQSAKDNSAVSDTVEMILEAHFERFTKPHVDALISAWSKNEGGLKNAILFFYRATNDSKVEFSTFLTDEFEGSYEDLEDEGLKESYRVLDIISDHCAGNLKEVSDPILGQCRAISSLSETTLEASIGRYFKAELSGYLREQFPSIYEEIENELSCAREGAAANDPMPSSSVFLSGASRLKGATKEVTEDGIAVSTEEKGRS